MTATLTTILHTEDLFDDLGQESEQKIPILKSKPNDSLDWLVQGFHFYTALDMNRISEEGKYSFARDILRVMPIKISAIDVTEFSLRVSNYESVSLFGVKLGHYLNSCINHCNDSEILVHTNHLGIPPEYIISFKGKTVKIKGDVGNRLGESMRDGEIIVNGNAEHSIGNEMNGGKIIINGNVGYFLGTSMIDGEIIVNGNARGNIGFEMNGGKILLKGNAGTKLGYEMIDGTIVVEGNAGYNIGAQMHNGLIYLNGKYKSIADDVLGGSIYHRGKLIVKDGELLK